MGIKLRIKVFLGKNELIQLFQSLNNRNMHFTSNIIIEKYFTNGRKGHIIVYVDSPLK